MFTETAIGALTERPVLGQVLGPTPPRDTLVVWKLDRLGRSRRHLVDTVTRLAERGIGFRSLQEVIDTTTPGGKLVFHVFAHRHGLDLVVGDVDRGGAQAPLQLGDLGAGGHPKLGVEVGQGLVHAEDLGLADDRPAHRDALPLPT